MLAFAAAHAAEPYLATDLAPYLRNDTSALVANHLLLQSMFAVDAAPSTVGVSLKAAPSRFRVANGEVATGSLSKWSLVAMAGGGAPTSGFAWFAGLDYAHVIVRGFPNVLGAARGPGRTVAGAGGGSAVFFGGVANRGLAAEVGLFVNGAKYVSDAYGRFGEGGCEIPAGCEPLRPGAPFEAPPEDATALDVTRRSVLVNLEQKGGHSLAALFSRRTEGSATRERTEGGLTVVRGLSQPYDLLPRAIGLLGAGVASYSPDVDYYGDEVAALRAARAADAGVRDPGAVGRRIWEVPLVGDRLADTGLLARVTFQVAPVPTFRLLEVGWADELGVGPNAVVQAGVRGRVFRRDTAYVPSADAYAGLFAVNPSKEGRGVSAYATFSYNSPDPLTFPPVPDAAVLGLQLVSGNPIALPPPVPIVSYPRWLEDE